MHRDKEQSELIDMPIYQLDKIEKQAWLEQQLLSLTMHHCELNPLYLNLIRANASQSPDSLVTIPPVFARLFKDYDLTSIAQDDVFRVMRSSGTGGAQSKIYLDSESAKLQSKILVKTLQHWLGKQRRPMLLVDSKATLSQAGGMTARAAGLQGLSFFGRNHCYALDENMQLDKPAVTEFFDKYKNDNILIFGFTFIVWQQFIQALQARDLKFDIKNAVLIHGGGWKKMQQNAITDSAFKAGIQTQLGEVKVHDYYGMVEQTGTIYMQCEQGYLHAPVWSDVLIRDINDLSPVPFGVQGLVQVNSVLASSYPGHCILTEDLGQIIGEDDCACGRKGKYFVIHGRVPKAQVRGCSDTFS
ncbi:acyl-protein synthetase [Catenovulum maritimum]|uniref:Acyl-protein synthetase n=1 Tax=Catenovulum maritimum TaxID=1513271 RepID=A0A0J8GV46_9ALTE|nr:acyl-protein synthetase [Catenovulum maritimum]KMT66607.1 acyl-protein synthetase [Catenovulum maritimum]